MPHDGRAAPPPALAALAADALAGRAARAEALLPGPPATGRFPFEWMAAARLAATAGGTRPFACGIVNAKSGRCTEDCAFCAQSARRAAAHAPEHPLLPADALAARAEALAAQGVDYMGIVTIGAGPSPGDFARLLDAGRYIAARVDIRLCASVGLLTAEQARGLRAAGFASVHHNLETARDFFPAVCTTHTFDRRVDTIRAAKAAGLRVCAGGLFGMGESWPQRLALSATLAALDVDSIPVNFLTPVAGTPLAGAPALPAAEALAVVAALRLMHPARDIVVCGGRTRTLGRFEALLTAAGANGLMVGDYLTTPGAAFDDDRALLAAMGWPPRDAPPFAVDGKKGCPKRYVKI